MPTMTTTATPRAEGLLPRMDAEDTPYGRLATATDPTGAGFKLVAGK
jgi:hypothetical protein